MTNPDNNTTNQTLAAVIKAWQAKYDQAPLLISAPGRINLIGEHTDYNNGYVFPAAVGQAIYFAIGKADDIQTAHITSLDQNDELTIDLSKALTPLPAGGWKNYILGVVAQLRQRGSDISGFNVIFSGDIPMGAGMSSSAALECGLCFGLSALFDLGISRPDMARLCQAAEHQFTGVKCGIMDQYASLMGREDHAFILDCQHLTHDYFPVSLGDYQLLLCNSNVSHSLADSAYNDRRAACEKGVEIIRQQHPEVSSLRDVTPRMLQAAKGRLHEEIHRRCKYIIDENARVIELGTHLRNNDLQQAGDVLRRAQAGMRTEYEITCEETEFLADAFNASDQVAGARQMGGGFGGCIIAVVRTSAVAQITQEITEAYSQKYRAPTFIPVRLAEGCAVIRE